MPDATIDHYEALVGKVHMQQFPILPQPTWGQGAAYLAFLIDGMRTQMSAMLPILTDLANSDPVRPDGPNRACKHCSANDWYNGVLTHDAECVWLRAKTYLLIPGEDAGGSAHGADLPSRPLNGTEGTSGDSPRYQPGDECFELPEPDKLPLGEIPQGWALWMSTDDHPWSIYTTGDGVDVLEDFFYQRTQGRRDLMITWKGAP